MSAVGAVASTSSCSSNGNGANVQHAPDGHASPSTATRDDAAQTHVNSSAQAAAASSPSSSRISMAALCTPTGSPRPPAREASQSSASRSTGTQAPSTKPRTRRESAAAAALAAAEEAKAAQAGDIGNMDEAVTVDSTSTTLSQAAAEVASPGKPESTQANGKDIDGDTDMGEALEPMGAASIKEDVEINSAAAPNADASSSAVDNKANEEAKSEQEDDEGDNGEDDEDEDEGEDEDEEDDDDDDDDDDEQSDSESTAAKSDAEGVDAQNLNDSNEMQQDGVSALQEGSSAAPSSVKVQASEIDGADKAESSNTAPMRKKPGPKPKGDKKKKMKRRSPSLDVSLPAGPPPRPTVRLKLTLASDEQDRYLFNVPDEIFKVLKPSNHAWAEWYEKSQAEESMGAETPLNGDDNQEMPSDLSELGDLARLLKKYPSDTPTGKKTKSRRMKGGKGEDMYEIGHYDTKDPFVDDSELGVDEPTHQAKPSADGFFVTQGEVELEKLERDKFAQSSRDTVMASIVGNKRSHIPAGFGEATDGAGGAGALFLEFGPTVESLRIADYMISQHAVEFELLSPQADPDDASQKSYFGVDSLLNGNKENGQGKREADENGSTAPRDSDGTRQSPIKVEDESKRSTPAPGSKGWKYPVIPVPVRLEREFDELRVKVAQTSWREKTKFPPTLRDPLIHTAIVAIALNEYNDNFFNWLPRIFPYNRLTLHKYTKRQIYDQHVELARRVQEKHFEGFKRQVDEMWPAVKKDYDEKVADWAAKGGKESTPEPPASQSDDKAEKPSASQGDDGAAHDGEGADGEDGESAAYSKAAADGSKPQKRWPWSEPLRETLFTILTIDNAHNELKAEKFGFENSNEKTSSINSRKVIYKRLIDFWPEEGWMTTTNLSNTYGLYKRKVDKFAGMLHDAKGRDVESAIAV